MRVSMRGCAHCPSCVCGGYGPLVSVRMLIARDPAGGQTMASRGRTPLPWCIFARSHRLALYNTNRGSRFFCGRDI